MAEFQTSVVLDISLWPLKIRIGDVEVTESFTARNRKLQQTSLSLQSRRYIQRFTCGYGRIIDRMSNRLHIFTYFVAICFCAWKSDLFCTLVRFCPFSEHLHFNATHVKGCVKNAQRDYQFGALFSPSKSGRLLEDLRLDLMHMNACRK